MNEARSIKAELLLDCLTADVEQMKAEVERWKAQHAKSYTDSANSAFAGGMERAADVVSAWPIAARLIRDAARAEACK